MTSRRLYLYTATVMVVGLMGAHQVSADDGARDWSQSMGYQSQSHIANAFNSASALRNLRKPGAGSGNGGGVTVNNCQTTGACPQGGTITQWNGVAVTTVTGSNITVDNTIDAESEQDATNKTKTTTTNNN